MQIGPSRGRHAAPLAGPALWRGWTPGAARAVAIVLLAAVALVAWWWWQGRPRPVDVVDAATAVEASQSQAPESSAQSDSDRSALVTVHVIGRVKRPGIVRVPEGSRVADAIAAAGGVRDRQAAMGVNLARVVVDGEQIDVRRPSARASGPSGAASSGEGGSLIDLNRADAAALESLPGIGPVLAERIVTWRDTNGPFPNVDVLGEVSGIGPALMERLRPLITV